MLDFAVNLFAGVRKDQIDVDWKRFFLFGIPLLGVFYYFYGIGQRLLVENRQLDV